mmetsp:Transcript_18741/g.48067  ORF Transcript_18741/g.48067 Transcript_18741/m.48067 type:complete len:200 (+) Transcript_18741:669-1268(+)
MGLTSTSVQSRSTKSLNSALTCSAAASLSPVTPSPVATSRACASLMPARMSTGMRRILSGNFSARSSMLVPPSLHAMMTGPADARSSRMAKYISLVNCIFLATSTVFTGFPASPVCLVTSTSPSIFPAMVGASAEGTMCTPPWRPLLKVPRPRPPARIWLFTTTSSPPSCLAALATASGVVHAIPGGTLTPKLSMSLAL